LAPAYGSKIWNHLQCCNFADEQAFLRALFAIIKKLRRENGLRALQQSKLAHRLRLATDEDGSPGSVQWNHSDAVEELQEHDDAAASSSLVRNTTASSSSKDDVPNRVIDNQTQKKKVIVINIRDLNLRIRDL
jgi:hypothetical protein